ncbi:TetR/AcrR family transcriptional regulator [Actinomadura graeca]|uniref:TetR/AcrR family transcriptional regulator n=1 Tax=Actinomadura graeca TaxID=2750812 RepID=A0ABX8QYH0_9ACTN|nr:TetR/AcrR family transcriptional regulator [Actinomadura graeca]QXJ23851.1 TetR/AcrR family transcriptional regulator [Actinomadura graeca]
MARADEHDESILDAAEKLFAQIGYDSTTLRMISEVAGGDVTVTELEERGKQQIYRQVFSRLYNIELEQITSAVRDTSNTIEGIHAAVDAFLDFVVEHSALPSLWRHRGLGDAADVPFGQRDYLAPLLVVLTTTPWEGISPKLNLRFLAWVTVWTSGAFVHDGFVDETGTRVFYRDARALQSFRSQLHELWDALNGTDTPR